MTEKQYGGATGRGMGKIESQVKTPAMMEKRKEENKMAREINSENSDLIDREKSLKAGKIASEMRKYAKSFIKKDMLLVEIADKIEAKAVELGAKPAFPTCLSINEIAAHDTPAFNDTRKAHGLLKVDFGAHIDGYIADTAFSIDLENSDENKKLIMAAEKAFLAACKKINVGTMTGEIGAAIEKEITSMGFSPVHNLSGHSIERYHLHAGITIPNYNNLQNKELQAGVYAIEPFATNGLGKIRDGKPSGIYRLEKETPVRDAFAREVLAFIYEEYQTIPFCARWIYKKFGSRGLLALRRIEEAGIVHHYAQLIEISGKNVAQAEHTVMIEKDKKTITTLEN
ncbi:MAG TPA: type II methionyl aminopeptidase [Candidatus Nanoarchaeia archaeon]|nr:type II methionyl aminopeptidase [Candidatus Nanoarchaeia archaeon]